MANWQERAEQERRLAVLKTAAEQAVAFIKQQGKPKEIDRKSKEYIVSMLSRFDQFNIGGVLEDINKTTPDGWGGLGRVTYYPQHDYIWSDDRPGSFEETPYTGYVIRLSADYTHYEKSIERTYRNARGWHYVNDGGGGMSSMGEPLSVSTKRVYGDYAEHSGFKDILVAKEASTSLLVEIAYFPVRDSFDISIEDHDTHRSIRLGRAMEGHSLYGSLPKDYQMTPPHSYYDGLPIVRKGGFFENNISLSFPAKSFDVNIIRRFLETSFAADTYLRSDTGNSLVMIRQKENENKTKIERGL